MCGCDSNSLELTEAESHRLGAEPDALEMQSARAMNRALHRTFLRSAAQLQFDQLFARSPDDFTVYTSTHGAG